MVDPITASIIASAISSGAGAIGSSIEKDKREAAAYEERKHRKKEAKRRAKETERETKSKLLDEALQRRAEHEASRMAEDERLGRRYSQYAHDTADLIREAFR